MGICFQGTFFCFSKHVPDFILQLKLLYISVGLLTEGQRREAWDHDRSTVRWILTNHHVLLIIHVLMLMYYVSLLFMQAYCIFVYHYYRVYYLKIFICWLVFTMILYTVSLSSAELKILFVIYGFEMSLVLCTIFNKRMFLNDKNIYTKPIH